jgi:hypothetical protein
MEEGGAVGTPLGAPVGMAEGAVGPGEGTPVGKLVGTPLGAASDGEPVGA